MKFLIALLTAATGILHLVVGFGLVGGGALNWLLVLNGVGYLVLLVLFWMASGNGGMIRWILLAYTLITLIGYFLLNSGDNFGLGNTFALIIKAIELLLVILLFLYRGSERVTTSTPAPAATRGPSGMDSIGTRQTTLDTTAATMASTASAGVTTAAAGAAAATIAYADRAAEPVESVVDEAVDTTGGAVDWVGDKAEDAYDASADMAGDAADAVGDAADATVDAAGDAVDWVGDKAEGAYDATADMAGDAADAVGDAADATVDAAGDAVDWVGDKAEGAYDATADFTADAADAVGDAADATVDAAGDAVDWVGDKAEGAYDATADLAADAADAVGDAVDATADAAGDAVDWTGDAVRGGAAAVAGAVAYAADEASDVMEADAAELDAADLTAEPSVEDLREELTEYLKSFGSSEFTKNVEYVEGIGAVYGQKLRDANIVTVTDLIVNGATRRGRKHISDLTGIAQSLILTWVNHVDLFRIKGVAQEYADLLEQSGVDTVVELAQRNPANLYKRMIEVNDQKSLVRRTPHASEVQSWVEQAKSLRRLIHY